MNMTVEQILQACGGTLLCGKKELEITSICDDSREILPGGLFVPIIGERNNAHDYIEKAFARGAVATLTQQHTKQEGSSHAWIRVENTQNALQQIAAAYRNQFSIPLIGVTGSVGKTTTKEMIALALSAEKNVMATAGNFNSQIGLPLTMFRLEPELDAAVIEMGMSDFGEMERLVKIAQPQYAVITNIGIAHIENLKSQENILKEKLHITDGFTQDSVLFVNGDDPVLSQIKNWHPGRLIVYGTGDAADYRAADIRTEGWNTIYTLSTPTEQRKVTLPALGIHNVLNSLAAIAVAQTLGLSLDTVISKLKDYTPPAMRQQIHEVRGMTIIDDTYNASPDSIKSGLNVLCSLEKTGRYIAVLADMLELGDVSEPAHFDVGVHAAQTGIDWLITVGKEAKHIAKGAQSARSDLKVDVFESNQQAIERLQKESKAGDRILVKGSRGMKTDEIVNELLQN